MQSQPNTILSQRTKPFSNKRHSHIKDHISMPLRGKLVNLGDKLNEMTERNEYMKNVFELTQKEEQEKTLQMLQ